MKKRRWAALVLCLLLVLRTVVRLYLQLQKQKNGIKQERKFFWFAKKLLQMTLPEWLLLRVF